MPVNLLIAATAAAFGPLLGFAYALAGALLAAGVVFGARPRARRRSGAPLCRPPGQRGQPPSRAEHGLWAMTLLRLLPIAPFSVVNLVAGAVRDPLSRLPARQPDRHAAPGVALMALFGDRLGAWLRRPDRVNLAILVGVALAVVALALALGRWAQAAARAVSAALRIASYNIHACAAWTGRQDVGRIAAVLREIDADVVGAAGGRIRATAAARSTRPRRSAQALGMRCIEGPLLHGERGWYGNALLTRRPVRAVRRVLFEDHGREARGAIVADLAAAGGVGWRVLTTHLDLHVGRRRRQFETLLDEILPATTVPTIVIGDFNEWWPFNRGLGALRRHAVAAVRAGAPSPAAARCWRSTAWRSRPAACAARVRRHITPLSRIASDHLPIWAEVVAEPAVAPAPPVARDDDAALGRRRRRQRSQRAAAVPEPRRARSRRDRRRGVARLHAAAGRPDRARAVLAADLPAVAAGDPGGVRGQRRVRPSWCSACRCWPAPSRRSPMARCPIASAGGRCCSPASAPSSAGSVVCALAPTIGTLIGGRIVQAIGASAGMVLARAIVRDLHDRERSASVIAYLTTAMVVAPMLAPTIGAVLIDLGQLARDLRPERGGRPGGDLADRPPPGRDPRRRRGRRRPVADVGRRRAAAAHAGRSLAYALQSTFAIAVFFAFISGAPYFMIDVLHRPATEYGLYFILVSAGFMAGNLLAARVTARVGLDRMILIGSALALAATLLALALLVGWGWAPIALFGPMLAAAFANGLTIPNAQAGAISVEPALAGTASGLAGFLQMFAAAAGQPGGRRAAERHALSDARLHDRLRAALAAGLRRAAAPRNQKRPIRLVLADIPQMGLADP